MGTDQAKKKKKVIFKKKQTINKTQIFDDKIASLKEAYQNVRLKSFIIIFLRNLDSTK